MFDRDRHRWNRARPGLPRTARDVTLSGVWARPVAIRPVPPFAVIDRSVLERIEEELSQAGEGADTILDAAFDRFEDRQPELAEHVASVLDRPLDETATALGSFLSIVVFMAFERAFDGRLGEVDGDALKATVDAVSLEEELRAQRPREPLDLEDVIAQEQPGIVDFIHVHLEAALDDGTGDHDVDVDDVHLVYQTMLVLVLALSHAVEPDERSKKRSTELLA